MSERPEWITAPGFYPDMGEDTYFLDPCPRPSLRQSGIKVLVGRSPYHFAFEHPRLNPYRQRNAATRFMRFGSAVHSVALGRGKEVSVIRYPDFRSSSAQRAAEAAVGAGRIPLLEREHERVTAVAGVVRAAIEEELEGAEYFTEVPMFWTEVVNVSDRGRLLVWCAGMLDVWCPSQLRALDVKASTVAAVPDKVSRDLADNGYDVQNAWYRRGLGKLIPAHAGRFRFDTLYVEADAPHGHCAFELDEASHYLAGGLCDGAVRSFARCLDAGSWPSYPRRATVGTPAYHHNALLNHHLEESANGAAA